MSGMVDDAAGIDPALGFVPRERDLARRELIHELLRCKTFLAGVGIVSFWVVSAVAGTVLAPSGRFVDSGRLLAPPSVDHWFGTDALGRDVFERVLFGATDTLTVAPAATLIGLSLGTAVGMTTGYYAGSSLDEAVGRAIDAVLALPLLVLAVLVIAATDDTSKRAQAIVIGLAFAPAIARTIRAVVLGERELDYVQAARLQGERPAYVMVFEILPNIVGTIVVEGTVRLGYAIFAAASLRFLGFGPQPPSPDWSLQIRENYPLLLSGTYWWTVLFAALAISTLVVGVNLVADGLQQVLDP
jgi:peptide/nickel transport system permease protein